MRNSLLIGHIPLTTWLVFLGFWDGMARRTNERASGRNAVFVIPIPMISFGGGRFGAVTGAHLIIAGEVGGRERR